MATLYTAGITEQITIGIADLLAKVASFTVPYPTSLSDVSLSSHYFGGKNTNPSAISNSASTSASSSVPSSSSQQTNTSQSPVPGEKQDPKSAKRKSVHFNVNIK